MQAEAAVIGCRLGGKGANRMRSHLELRELRDHPDRNQELTYLTRVQPWLTRLARAQGSDAHPPRTGIAIVADGAPSSGPPRILPVFSFPRNISASASTSSCCSRMPRPQVPRETDDGVGVVGLSDMVEAAGGAGSRGNGHRRRHGRCIGIL